MSLQNSTLLYKKALKEHYGIGAFNFVNLETLMAIIESAKETKSPIIVQTSTSAIKYMGIQNIEALVKANANDVDIVLNLDHGKTYEDCVNAINHGFTNVMIDASSLPFEENVALTKKVVEYAHLHNVTVEAELGVLQGVEDDVKATSEDAFYTNPNQAKEFATRTQIDSLAIAIGTSHGTHKFSGTPQLQFDILSQIEELLPNLPLVLHGASSIPQNLVNLAENYGAKLNGANGVPESMIKEACTKHNICKVNVDSDLRIAFTAGVRKHLSTNLDVVDIRKYLQEGKTLTKDLVTNKINNMLCSNNKQN